MATGTPPAKPRPLSLLEILIQKGKLTPEDARRALAEQQRRKGTTEDVLMELGLVAEADLLEIRAHRMGFAFRSIESLYPPVEVVLRIPEAFSTKRLVIALDENETHLTVALADPNNVSTQDELRQLSGKRLNVVMATRGDILKKLGEYRDHYKAAAVERLMQTVRDQGLALSARLGLKVGDLKDIADQSAVVKAVNLVLLKGLVKRASDIHIMPTAKHLQVQYRVDGELVPAQVFPHTLAQGVVSRIKIMANLDIAEKRLPQDGSFHLNIDGRELDMRVATTPCLGGEKVVLRILDKQGMMLGLDNLGLAKENYLSIRRNMRRPNGIILVVGPTGSGKTTTLYSMLQALNRGTKNITTVEDPIEYQIDGITQIQTHADIGLTFAAVLRSVLRQDPDIVLIGEIRDQETCEIAIRASLTGHLVFATLHTNDAVSAVTRLLDIGVEPFLISSALRCVISQRLVRTICRHCRQPAGENEELLEMLPVSMRKLGQTFRGQGCYHCFNTGYRGRTIISEVLEIKDEIRRHIVQRSPAEEIARAAVAAGLRPMFQDGMDKVAEGVTTLDETLTVCDDTLFGMDGL